MALISTIYGSSKTLSKTHTGYANHKKPQKQKTRYDEYLHTRMPFGKHKGKWISEIPRDYLVWGLLNMDNYIATMFSMELQRREPDLRKSKK